MVLHVGPWRGLRWAVALALVVVVYLSINVPPNHIHGARPDVGTATNQSRPLTVLRLPTDPGQRQYNTSTRTCQRAQVSPHQVADSNGRVCAPVHLTPTGCCPDVLDSQNGPQAAPYSCTDCSAHQCCAAYEHCVACCSAPRHSHIVTRAVGQRPTARLLLERTQKARTQFEWCTLLCRTHSKSTQHQNKFRDKHERFCFGEAPPKLVPTFLK
eukprot:m.109490 g.109490  ORF g.109490 m.109490 type:complete len:213 (-) comp10689_c0_seq15:3295-3933(-)